MQLLELEEVRAAESQVHLFAGDRQLPGRVLGQQEQEILCDEHALDTIRAQVGETAGLPVL